VGALCTIDRYQSFGGACRLHIQSGRINLEGKDGARYSAGRAATVAEVDVGSRTVIHMPGIFVSINYVVFRSCPLFPINQPKTHNTSKGYGGV